MLDFAINHEEDLRKNMRSIMFDDKFKFENFGSYYDDFKLDKTIAWNNIQCASYDEHREKVIGNIHGRDKTQTKNENMEENRDMTYVQIVNQDDVFFNGMVLVGVATVYLICLIAVRKFKEWKKKKWQ